MRFLIERRALTPRRVEVAIPLVSVVLAFVVSGVLLRLLGVSPVNAFLSMTRGALGDWYGISETIVKATPLALCGLAVSLAFRMQIWNIGAEGQLYIGALATAAVVRYAFVDSSLVMLVLMGCAAACAGGLWGMFAGWLKARWNVNEIISTLMLNYIAIHAVDYVVYGPWRDPGSMGFPMTAPFPDAARLMQFWDSRVHMGLLIAMALAAFFWVLIKRARWGFEIRVIGENPKAAAYAGIPYLKNVLLLMFVSGAVAGLAGMCEIAGLQGRLQHGFSSGYGYTAIIVAWLGRLHPVAILGVSFLLGALLVGGDTLQVVMRLPLASTLIIQGFILFFVLGGEFFRHYRIRLARKEG